MSKKKDGCVPQKGNLREREPSLFPLGFESGECSFLGARVTGKPTPPD